MVGTSWTRKRARKKRNRYPSPSPLPPPSPSTSPSPSPDISFGVEKKTDDKNRIATLLDTDLLNCPICFQPFTNFIFQCNNGHLACSSCSKMLWNKCPNCSLPIGKIRSRTMEKIVESVTIPCPNSTFGCTEMFSYKDQKTHENECLFSACSCPLQDCKYIGNYKDLYHHFDSTHKGDEIGYDWYVCGTKIDVWMHKSESIYVLKEAEECLLFVVQRFSESNGEYVRVSFFGPFGVKFDIFSYRLSMSSRYKIKYESLEMKIQEVKSGTSEEEDFMFFPRYLIGGNEILKMKLKVRKFNQK